MTRDTLLRSAAAAAVLGCLAYFAFGLAAVVAAELPGSAIHMYEPVTFALLWQEVSKTSSQAVIAWTREGENGFWLSLMLSVALALASFALTFVVNPRILCSRHPAVIAGLGCGMGLLFVVGFWGLFSLLFTFLNAFALGGLDGEWVIEAIPLLDAIGLLYLIACLLFRRSLSFDTSGRRTGNPTDRICERHLRQAPDPGGTSPPGPARRSGATTAESAVARPGS